MATSSRSATPRSEPDITMFNLEPRCHVCRNDNVRQKVNDLLA
jgi:hypothetical protein